jgi:hypothetical protein
MIARFFDILSTQKDSLGSSFSKYIELFLERNAFLLEVFAIFYRVVLHKLNIEKAEDFKVRLNF